MFCAGGKGNISVAAMRYHDTKDGKAKHRYRRTVLPTEIFYKTVLTENQRLYSCEYIIRPDEWIGLRFAVSGDRNSFAILDNVAVIPN